MGEESLRERDEYFAPLIGGLEEIDDEDIASIQDEGDYAADFFKSIINALECIDDNYAVAIQEAKDAAKQVTGSLDGVNQTIEIEPPHKLIDYQSLCRDLEDMAMVFEDMQSKQRIVRKSFRKESTELFRQ